MELVREGDVELEGRPLARRRGDAEGAAGGAQPLAGRLQADVELAPCAGAGRPEAAAVVRDTAVQDAAALAEPDDDVRRPGVLADVDDRLAQGAVDQRLDLAGVASRPGAHAHLGSRVAGEPGGEVAYRGREARRLEQ